MPCNLVSRQSAEPRVTLKRFDVNVAQQSCRLPTTNQRFEASSLDPLDL